MVDRDVDIYLNLHAFMSPYSGCMTFNIRILYYITTNNIIYTYIALNESSLANGTYSTITSEAAFNNTFTTTTITTTSNDNDNSTITTSTY